MIDETRDRDLLRRNSGISRATSWIREYTLSQAQYHGQYIVSESIIRLLHTLCMSELLPSDSVGYYRRDYVVVGDYTPPPPEHVPAMMRELIVQLNRDWKQKDLIQISAYALWRLNYIHPFRNGNGRVSRLYCWLLMHMRAGRLLPGDKQIVPVQLAETEYHNYILALKASDGGDMLLLEKLLERCLTKQLASTRKA